MDIFLLTPESRTTTAVEPVEGFTNVLSGTLAMEINGEFSVTFVTREGAVIPKREDCIGLTVPGYKRMQKFVIKRTTEGIEGAIEVYAEHISYDLLSIPPSILSYTAYNTLEMHARSILEHTLGKHNFTLGDVPKGGNSRSFSYGIQYFDNLRESFGGKDRSLLDTFHGILYRFDNEIVHIYEDYGDELGIVAYKGHNLLDLSMVEDTVDSYDAIFPYVKVENDDGTINMIFMSGNSTKDRIYPSAPDDTLKGLRILSIDLSDQFETSPSTMDLRAKAVDYFNANVVSDVRRTIESNILDLSKAIGLENEPEIKLFDKIDFPFRENLFKLRVESIKINVLNDRVEKIYVNRKIIENKRRQK